MDKSLLLTLLFVFLGTLSFCSQDIFSNERALLTHQAAKQLNSKGAPLELDLTSLQVSETTHLLRPTILDLPLNAAAAKVAYFSPNPKLLASLDDREFNGAIADSSEASLQYLELLQSMRVLDQDPAVRYKVVLLPGGHTLFESPAFN